jgi:hypothetical protein
MKKPILVDFYEGAYGPTIRIDMRTREDLLVLDELFGNLASDVDKEFDLARSTRFRLGSIVSLSLRSVAKQPPTALEVSYTTPAGASFRWSNNCDEWRDCKAKVEALLASALPGHQYLTAEGRDDALVELSFLE